jgi:hypothetical protein
MSQQPPQHQEPVYEPPDDERPASASPTEAQLNFETPTVAALDQSPPPLPHDPYAALRLGIYRLYVSSYALAIIGGQVQSVAVAWQIYQKTQSALSLGWVGGIQVIPLFLLALPAGHVADTVSRKKLLIATQWLLADGACCWPPSPTSAAIGRCSCRRCTRSSCSTPSRWSSRGRRGSRSCRSWSRLRFSATPSPGTAAASRSARWRARRSGGSSSRSSAPPWPTSQMPGCSSDARCSRSTSRPRP